MAKAFADSLHKALTSGDPNAWAAARERVKKLDLAGVDLASKMLADFDLSGADFSNADLSEADLTGASLDDATFDGADFTAAKLLELEVSGASFVGAALDDVKLDGTFVSCNFTDTTWINAVARGARFVQCDFDGAEMDVAALARANRFDRCTFGDRDDLPEEITASRPEFLQPPFLEGERVTVSKLALSYASEPELRDEVIGVATSAGWDVELVAFLRDGDKIYVGLRPEASVDELEEWLAFAPGPKGKGLTAVELSIDPGFDTFVSEVVIPLFEAGGGDLDVTIEQDLDEGGVGVTQMAVVKGKALPAKQSKR